MAKTLKSSLAIQSAIGLRVQYCSVLGRICWPRYNTGSYKVISLAKNDVKHEGVHKHLKNKVERVTEGIVKYVYEAG